MAVPMPLYSLMKPKNPISTASSGSASSIGKSRREERLRSASISSGDLVRRQIGERVIEDLPDAVQVPDVVAIPPVVDYRVDLLVVLNSPELLRDAVRQQVRAAEAGIHLRRCLEPERRERPGKGARV